MEIQTQAPRTVKLDFELFKDLYLYAYRHSDPDDLQYRRLTVGVQKKLQSMMRHDMYSSYVTGKTVEERKAARNTYLNSIGLSDGFRWPDSYDVHFHPQDDNQ